MAWLAQIRANWLPVPDAFLNAVSSNRGDSGRRALASFVKEDAAFRNMVLSEFRVPADAQITPSQRTAVAGSLTRYGMRLAEQDDYLRSASALLYALLVVPDYLEAVAGMAILYHAWEDQIAGRWAEHFRTLTAAEVPPHSYIESGEDNLSAQTEVLRKQMLAIVAECKEHPEWRDSSADLQRFGMRHEGRYGT